MHTHARQSFHVILGVTRHSTTKKARLISVFIRWDRRYFASKCSAKQQRDFAESTSFFGLANLGHDVEQCQEGCAGSMGVL